MAKPLNILAASVVGGIALGLGIRVGKCLLHHSARPAGTGLAEAITLRLETLENRLASLDSTPDAVEAVIAVQAAEIDAIRNRLKKQTEPGLPNAKEISRDPEDWVNTTLNARLADVEARVRKETEDRQQVVLDAFIENVQTRVVQRIAKLERDVTAQGVALRGLKEYSMQTERNMQKLLDGIERLVSNPAPSNQASGSTAAPTTTDKYPERIIAVETAPHAESLQQSDAHASGQDPAPPPLPSWVMPQHVPNFTQVLNQATERRPGRNLFSRLFR